MRRAVTVAAAASLMILAAAFDRDAPGSRALALDGSNGRLTVVISDLHMGIGRDPATGQWHPTEDFRWADAFGSFLRAIDEAGKGSTDLVLNGDTFELWQPIGSECRHPDVRLGCTEA